MNDEVTFGFMSKAVGETSNKISESKNADNFNPSLPQFFEPTLPVILCATSFWTRKWASIMSFE